MIRKAFLLLISVCPLLLFAQTNLDQGIKWVEGLSWDQIKEKAKAENKFIFIDCYATWCGPCKKMDREVYPNKNVGDALNQQFLSVRIQMDETDKDDSQVKNWYSVAKQLNNEYGINGYPSFLFFNPDGNLAHKVLGFRDALGFIEVAKDALTDPEARYKRSMEKFKNGQLDYMFMPGLIWQAWNKKEEQAAIEMLKIFKEKYVDNLTDEKAFQKENLRIIAKFSSILLNSNDRYFRLFYNHPKLADSIMCDKLSSQIVLRIIQKEEIYDKIYNNDRPITSPKPNWKSYEYNIKRKYGEQYANKLLPDDQILFYQIAGDWKNYIKYVNEKIKRYTPKAGGNHFGGQFGDAWMLNHYAWQLFLYSEDEKHLMKGLPWIDMAIRLDTTAYNAGYYDTKANLLYRMKRIKEAIDTEENALKRSEISENPLARINYKKTFTAVLEKMKVGLPTWSVQKEKKNQRQ